MNTSVRSTWQKLTWVGLILVVAALAACSGAEEDTAQLSSGEPTETTIAEAAVSATTEPTEEPTHTPVPTETPPPTDTPAPTETPVPTPEPTLADCLVGSWEIVEFGAYMASVLQGVGNIELVGQEGNARFDYGADGAAAVTADNFVTSYAGNIAGVGINLDVTVNGSGSADYSVVDNQIFYSNPIGEGLVFAASMGGNQLFSYQIDNIGELFGMDVASPDEEPFTITCEGDTLQYTPPVDGAAPVEMARVGS